MSRISVRLTSSAVDIGAARASMPAATTGDGALLVPQTVPSADLGEKGEVDARELRKLAEDEEAWMVKEDRMRRLRRRVRPGSPLSPLPGFD